MSYINDHLDKAGAAAMGFVSESLCSWIYIYDLMEFVPQGMFELYLRCNVHQYIMPIAKLCKGFRTR